MYMFELRDLLLSTKIEEMISYKYRNIPCILDQYFDAIIYSIGVIIISVVILARVCYFCEWMSMNNNGANGFVVFI